MAALFVSCNDDRIGFEGDGQLAFSVDTLMFDTVFTTLGSTTLSFKAYNPHSSSIEINSIKLAGGKSSFYRLNIDGQTTNEAQNIEVPAHDSVFIFVEVTIDPNGKNNPMIVQDSVVFTVGKTEQDVDLIAWGQDFVPIYNEYIPTSTWTAEKPYLVFDRAIIDSNITLTIEPGTIVHFYKNALLISAGVILAKGTPEKPITFKTSRLEHMYFDIPDMWEGIVVYPNETPSVFENVNIFNAHNGLRIGEMEYGVANAKLHNVRIEHSGQVGLWLIKSNIEASNLLVAHNGSYSLAIQGGGDYSFNHCTFANYWKEYKTRKNPSLIISNYQYNPLDSNIYMFDLSRADLTNCIIWGDAAAEIGIYKHPDAAFVFNCNFDNSLVKASDSLINAEPEIFKSMVPQTKSVDYNSIFKNYNKFDYQLDSLSPARNVGLRKYAERTPLDLKQVSRLADIAPDLGAYERVDSVYTK